MKGLYPSSIKSSFYKQFLQMNKQQNPLKRSKRYEEGGIQEKKQIQ